MARAPLTPWCSASRRLAPRRCAGAWSAWRRRSRLPAGGERFHRRSQGAAAGLKAYRVLGVWTHRAPSRGPGATWDEPLPEGLARSAHVLISTDFHAPRRPRDESREDRREPLIHPTAWSASVQRIGFSSQGECFEATRTRARASLSPSWLRRPQLNHSD